MAMNKIIVFDTSYGSSNLGDFIINEAINREMGELLAKNFTIRYPTHTPLLHMYQTTRKTVISENCKDAKYKLLAGTNLLKVNLLGRTPDWNINIFTKYLYKDAISMGCGIDSISNGLNWYTKNIYDTVFSKDFTHSVRDEESRLFLESLGLRVINTGCPTTWSLTQEHCSSIPTQKADSVIFTLTDYKRDALRDQKLIDVLVGSYNNIYFWIQGTEDYDYFKSFSNTSSIELVNPNLDAYRGVLRRGKIDYVGTRLHAGIFAMQHKVRSIILVVDNRARDMQQSYNINAIERDEIDKLEAMINSEFVTNVKIDEAKIKEWKSQFIEA